MSHKERHSISMALKFVLEGGPLRKKCLVMLRGVAMMRKRPRNTDLSDNVTSWVILTPGVLDLFQV